MCKLEQEFGCFTKLAFTMILGFEPTILSRIFLPVGSPVSKVLSSPAIENNEKSMLGAFKISSSLTSWGAILLVFLPIFEISRGGKGD